MYTHCRYKNAALRKVSLRSCLLFSLFGFEPKPSISQFPWVEIRQQPHANGWNACVQECTVWCDVKRDERRCVKRTHVSATVDSSMSKKDKNTPSCSTTHMPVLEGRNQPALKIDMRRERSRAAAEGEHAGRGGRWQLVAWISASQTGPMAILHTRCPAESCQGRLACPAQQWTIKAPRKGPPAPSSAPSLLPLPMGKIQPRWPVS